MSPDNNDPFPGSAAGDIGAIRCAFIMLYAGVKDVRVLNGGFQLWVDAGILLSLLRSLKFLHVYSLRRCLEFNKKNLNPGFIPFIEPSFPAN